MFEAESYAIRSFFVVIYDAQRGELARYQVPVSVAAPFTNRLFVHMIPDWQATVREPWYSLAPHTELQFQRAELPEGPTSLYGKRYDPTTQTPPTISLHPAALVTHFVVRLYDLQQKLYKGVYSVDDIFLHGAHHLLHDRLKRGELPAGRGPYYYAIVPSTRTVRAAPPGLLPEDAYQVEGVFRLPPLTKDEPRIQFRRVPPPPAAERDPAAFGAAQTYGSGAPQAGRVFIPARLYAQLQRELALSPRREEGGYLLGNVYRLPGSPAQEDSPEFRWLVEITDLLMAEGTVGTAAMLLFTGDAWSDISRRRDRDYAGRKLVGWFHTHLFPASDTFGLSGLDQDMHIWYLPQPWQIAILLNLEEGADRTVRCYQRGPEGQLVETPFEVFEEE